MSGPVKDKISFHYHSGEWSKPQAALAVCASLAAVALTLTTVALFLLKHYNVSFTLGPIHIHPVLLSNKSFLFMAIGSGVGIALGGTGLIYTVKKAYKFKKKMLEQFTLADRSQVVDKSALETRGTDEKEKKGSFQLALFKTSKGICRIKFHYFSEATKHLAEKLKNEKEWNSCTSFC